MNILIIDDDRSTVEMLLRTIDWEQLEISEQYAAYNIGMARAVFEERPVDIMLCDIEMPGGSGLELLSWVREQGYATRNIFLTNHTKFHLAQQAIQLDTVDFIGKLSSIEEITAAVRRAVSAVRAMDVTRRYARYGHYWEEHSGLLIRQFWQDVLGGVIAPPREEIRRAARLRDLHLELQGDFVLVMMAVFREQETIRGWPDQELDFCIGNIAAEVLFGRLDQGQVLTLPRDAKARYGVVLPIVNGSPNGRTIRDQCGELGRLVWEYLGCAVHFCVSPPVPCEGLAGALAAAEEEEQNNVALSRGVVMLEEQRPFSGETEIPRMDMEPLTLLLLAGQTLKTVNEVRRYFDGLPRDRADRQFLDAFLHDYMQALFIALKEKKLEAHLLFQKENAQSLFQKAPGSLYDMMKWVSFYAGAVTAAIQEASQSLSAVGVAKSYIEEHYAEHISKTELGAHCYLNPDYLAKLFKKETGAALGDYISAVRVEKAKILLRDPEIPLGDVAVRTGFDYYSYFSTIFKKAMGMSPSEYRKKVLEKE